MPDLDPAHSRLLNVGCGSSFHPDWVNIDIVPASAQVIAADIRQGLEFADCSFDAVYCSHVLEHLRQEHATRLLLEIYRTLRPGGIVRLAVPDLEALAREYLRLLESLKTGAGAAEADYDWIMLELFDQAVRDRSGGDMARVLADPALPNREYVRARIGAEAERAWEVSQIALASRLAERVRVRGVRWLLAEIRQRLAGVLIRAIGGQAAQAAYSEGMFRRSGEIHRWMYDAFSLERALRRAGFGAVRRQSASDSAIPRFAEYGLDIDPRGRAKKPDSLFMEAERPRS